MSLGWETPDSFAVLSNANLPGSSSPAPESFIANSSSSTPRDQRLQSDESFQLYDPRGYTFKRRTSSGAGSNGRPSLGPLSPIASAAPAASATLDPATDGASHSATGLASLVSPASLSLASSASTVTATASLSQSPATSVPPPSRAPAVTLASKANPLARLRIGSSGSPPPGQHGHSTTTSHSLSPGRRRVISPTSMSSETEQGLSSPIAIQMDVAGADADVGFTPSSAFVPAPTSRENAHVRQSSGASFESSGSRGTGPWSPAASFLSHFSPPNSGFLSGTAVSPKAEPKGDEAGFVVAGFTLGAELGAGGFGVVRRAVRKEDGREFAVKVVSNWDDEDDAGMDEDGGGEVMKSLSQSLIGLGRSGSLARSQRGPQGMMRTASINSNSAKGRVMVDAQRNRSVSTPAAPQSFSSLVYSPPSRPIDGMPPSTTAETPSKRETLLAREIRVWRRVPAHPNVVPLIDVHATSDHTYVVMKWCRGGNLLDYVREQHSSLSSSSRGRLLGAATNAGRGGRGGSSSSRSRDRSAKGRKSEPLPRLRALVGSPSMDAEMDLGESANGHGKGGVPVGKALEIFAQIVEGLYHLHRAAGVTHNDLKLENILLDLPESQGAEGGAEEGAAAGTWMIADFGLASGALDIPEDAGPVASESMKERDASRDSTRSGRSEEDYVIIPDGDQQMNLSSSRSRQRSVSPLPPLSESMISVRTNISEVSSGGSSSHRAHVNTVDHGPAGSLPYLAPELLKASSAHQPAPDEFTVDIWALGCILYALVEGGLPFMDEFEPRLRMKIVKGDWEMPAALLSDERGRGSTPSRGGSSRSSSASLRSKAREILAGCLEVNPSNRWTIDHVRAAVLLPAVSTSSSSSRGSTRGESVDGLGEGSPRRHRPLERMTRRTTGGSIGSSRSPSRGRSKGPTAKDESVGGSGLGKARSRSRKSTMEPY